VVLDETVMADKEAADKRVVEEAATKRAADKRVVEEATATKELAGKTANGAAKAAGGSPAPGQAPSAAEAKRSAAPSGSTLPAKRHYRGVWKPRFVQLSLALFSFFPVGLHSLITLFAQVLSLRCDHRDRHDCFCHRHRRRRCGCRGDSRAGS
jgi:hypothetical protein